jgi:hypothetical protein
MNIKKRILEVNCKYRANLHLTKDADEARIRLHKAKVGSMSMGQLSSVAWLLLDYTAKKEGWDAESDLEEFIKSL